MIGIVGGTFDPVHYGHLCPVERLIAELDLLEVRYVLSARPPHRPAPVAPAAHRLRMLELALEPYPRFRADDQEVRRPGPSFTLWTLRNLRQRYAKDSLCLIMGMDAYLGIQTWHRWEDIASLAHIVVLSRPGWRKPPAASDEREDLYRRQSGSVVFVDSIELPFNATDIRLRLQRGEDVGDALPAAVLAYIRRNNIYSEPSRNIQVGCQ